MEWLTNSKLWVEIYDDTEFCFTEGGTLTIKRFQALRYACKHGVGALMKIFVFVEASGWHKEAMLAIW
jgi:hypothetical protein